METILEIKNLSVKFGKEKPILDNISFQVNRGELISLIGMNGTGKTTLLKAIAGMIPLSHGAIVKHVQNIFYIPQRSDLDTSFPLTVKEFCELYGSKEYPEYLQHINMHLFLNSKVSNLSGGEFQRVLIALALSQKPDLLLLDEATAGVDIAGEESFYELITEISKKYGVAMILVSHNIHLVIKNADKVLCLAGHICCTGTAEEIEHTEEFKKIFGKHLQPYIHHHDHTH